MHTTMTRNEFSAPLGTELTATLRFLDGVGNVRIRSDFDMSELFHARFERKVPLVESAGGIVTVSYRHGRGGQKLGGQRIGGQRIGGQRIGGQRIGGWSRARGEVVLNAMVPWSIAVQGGVSNLEADLTGISLLGLDIGSGVSRLDASLPNPMGDVGVRIGGGVSHLRLHRPIDSAASVHVGGGASQIRFDNLQMGAVGGSIDWSTPGFDDADDRYEIRIRGGVSDVAFDAR